MATDGTNNGNGGNGGNGGTNNGNGGNGGNGDNGDKEMIVTPPVDADPGRVDTHFVNPEGPDAKRGWIVWVHYEDDRPTDTGLDFNEDTGFDITILDEDGNNITEDVGDHVVQTSGPSGDSIQFFVPTDSPEITVEVEGLVPDHVATFTMTEDGPVTDPEGTTFQTQPL